MATIFRHVLSQGGNSSVFSQTTSPAEGTVIIQIYSSYVDAILTARKFYYR